MTTEEARWVVEYSSEDLNGTFGPFDTRSQADEWAARQRPTAEWSVVPLYPVERDYPQVDPADRRLFVVDEKTYDDLTALLDRPAVYRPGLADLLAEESRFRSAAPSEGSE